MGRRLLVVALFLGGGCPSELAEQPLRLTADELLLDGEPLLQLKDAVCFDYLNLPNLEEALRARLKQAPTANPCGAITAPASTPFAVVRRVLYSCQVAELSPVGFRLTPEAPPTTLGRWRPQPRTELEAVLTPTALTLHSSLHPALDGLRGERPGPMVPAPLARALALEFSARPGLRTGTVSLQVEDALPLGEVLEVVEGLKAEGLTVHVAPATD